MSSLIAVPGWDSVPELETDTRALAGPGGPMNTQAQALLDRTEQLNPDNLPSRAGSYNGAEIFTMKVGPTWVQGKTNDLSAYIIQALTQGGGIVSSVNGQRGDVIVSTTDNNTASGVTLIADDGTGSGGKVKLRRIASGTGIALSNDADGNVQIGATGLQTLPIATSTQLGGVMVGTGLSIDGTGLVTLPSASSTQLGGVKVGTGLSVDGTGLLTLPVASATQLGGVKVGSGLSVDGTGLLSATAQPSPVTNVSFTQQSVTTSNGTPTTINFSIPATAPAVVINRVSATVTSAAPTSGFNYNIQILSGSEVAYQATALTGSMDDRNVVYSPYTGSYSLVITNYASTYLTVDLAFAYTVWNY